jgi:hypothetical protein
MKNYWRMQTAAVALGFLSASVAAASTTTPSTQPSATGNSSTLTASSGLSASGDFNNLSLDQLLNVDVRSPASLTDTDPRTEPVDVTRLDATDIEESGARDLNHLMEDYVPNTQVIDHNTPGDDVGFRGIISDREDKYLYQVDGVTMNNRMLYGANIERDLPLLGDINSVAVVLGPASATYGSGALAGVIDTQTYNGLTFQGADLTVRQGVVDQYTSTELRFGRQFTDDSGLFVYYGYADVTGTDAPYFISDNYAAKNGLPANVSGQPYQGPKADLGAPAFGAPFQKAHVDYTDGPWDFWARFVQDGTDTQPRRDIYVKTIPTDLTDEEWTDGRSILNQQFTTAGKFKKDLSDQWNVELLQSYDIWLARDQREGVTIGDPIRDSYENQLFSRAIATWKPDSSQTLAIGTEFSHLWYHDPSQSDALDKAPVVTQRDWETDTVSLLMEDQWKLSKQWTSFLSFRADKNTYTGWLLSPRGTLVYEANKSDTWKAMAGQAVRRQDDEDIWGQWERTRTYAPPETLLTCELSYEHKFNDQWTFSDDAFYEDYNAVGWNPAAQEASSLGHFQIAGGEVDLSYRTDNTRVTFSEGVSQLVFASVPAGAPAAGQVISSAPYGFGNNLADWAPSITKLAITHEFSKRWSGSTSIVYYSGFPGAQEYAQYAATLTPPPSGVPLSAAGNNVAYGPNVYVNLGVEYKPSEQISLRVDGYNLVALGDMSLSKRNNILRESEYSEMPASVAFSVRYKF